MRINIIEPKLLLDQHLIAEYREIKMLPKSLSRSLRSRKGFDKKRIPLSYTLNTGHGYFFYNKLLFIEKRMNLLVKEMQKRGFQTKHVSIFDDKYIYESSMDSPEFWNDYSPTPEEQKINIERIIQRYLEKETWYKYYGEPIAQEKYFKLINS